MAVKFIPIQCPKCGADLSYEEGRKVLFCSYCGAKILVDQYNENEHIYRNIDEADVKRAETDRMVQMRELDLEEKGQTRGNAGLIIGIIALGILAIIGCIGMSVDNEGMMMCLMLDFIIGSLLIWHYGDVFEQRKKNSEERKRLIRERENLRAGKIRVPQEEGELEGKNYKAVEELLRTSGFRNISVIPMGNLTLGVFEKPGMTETVTIAGREDFSSDDWFKPDDKVIITYHSMH